MRITVLTSRLVGADVYAVVRAENPPNALTYLRLKFPILGRTDIWAAEREDALKYLDPE